MRGRTLVVALLALTSVATAEDLLTETYDTCVNADSWSSCLKRQVIGYMDEKLGTTTEARSLENGSEDEALVARTFKYLRGFDYGVDLPFVDASLKYRPSRSLADLDVEFKDNRVATEQARGMLKKKVLLPLLLLLKIKMKAIMPIFMALIGIKAFKALIVAKLALGIILGFIAVQFFKKGGMAMPNALSMDPTVTAYGAPPAPSTTSSYDPANTWDASGGPYSRVWTPSNGADSQNLAYNYYSGSNSAASPSSSNSASSGYQ